MDYYRGVKQEMIKSLNKATRRQLSDFLVDCLGYGSTDCDEYSVAQLREAILEFELADKQGDQFGGFTF